MSMRMVNGPPDDKEGELGEMCVDALAGITYVKLNGGWSAAGLITAREAVDEYNYDGSMDDATDDGPGYERAKQAREERKQRRRERFTIPRVRLTYPESYNNIAVEIAGGGAGASGGGASGGGASGGGASGGGASGGGASGGNGYFDDAIRYVRMTTIDPNELTQPYPNMGDEVARIMRKRIDSEIERTLMGLEPEPKEKTQPLSPHFSRRIDLGDE